jgi:hypothetical protein
MEARTLARIPLKDVSVDAFHEGPGPYGMSFAFDLNALIRSLRRLGLVNTPIVREGEGEGLEIVAGYRRILALKSLGMKAIPCRVLGKSSLSPLECLDLNLHDNISTRALNEVEKGMVLRRLLAAGATRKDILEGYMPLLGLPSHESTLDLYVRVERELEEEWLLLLASGRLSTPSTRRILDMGEAGRSSLHRVLSNIPLNVNQLKQFIEYIIEISEIRNVPVSQLVQEDGVRAIMFNDHLNAPQKAKALLSLSRAWRLPTLDRAEKDFRKRVSALRLPRGVRVEHPPYFESRAYRLEILFQDGEELLEKLGSLGRIKDLGSLGDPRRGRAQSHD